MSALTLQLDEAVIAKVVKATVIELVAAGGLPADRDAFDEAEAAQRLGMPKHQLRDARLRGQVRGVKVGKRMFYSRSELLKLVTPAG